MAKRFTENGKWEDAWFRKLPPKSKLFWMFILDRCDIAGFWEIDWELASFYIGESIDETILNDFNGRLKAMPDGKIWIVKFIKFQYGDLNPAVKLHRAVISILENKGLIEEGKGLVTLNEGLGKGSVRVSKGLGKGSVRVSKGLGKGSVTLKDKDRDKDKDKDKEEDKEKDCKEKEKEEEGVKKKGFELPDFIDSEVWKGFVEMRNKIKKPLTDLAIKKLISKLGKFREQGEDVKEVLEQSIVNCWQDVYPVKNKEGKNNGKYRDIPVIKASDFV